jgi:hypothetical protein
VPSNDARSKLTPAERRLPANRLTRIQFRKRNPDIDAKLFLLGNVTTVQSFGAKSHVLRQLRANRGILEDAEPEQMEVFEKVLGSSLLNVLQNENRNAPETTGQELDDNSAAGRWNRVSRHMDSTMLKSLSTVWEGGEISDVEMTRLRSLFNREPLGQTNFNTWLKQTVRQTQANAANESASGVGTPAGR